MSDSTTIRVSIKTLDALRQLADRDGLTLDAKLGQLIRRERRRMIGTQLASAPLDDDEDRRIIASLARDPEFARIARNLDLEDAARELGVQPG